jgi:uncharacterized protein with HEPN domain
MKRDRIYLDHIPECIGWIERFTVEGREAFLKDRKTQSAVLRELQTLAESTERLSEEFKSRYPQIPWRKRDGVRSCNNTYNEKRISMGEMGRSCRKCLRSF